MQQLVILTDADSGEELWRVLPSEGGLFREAGEGDFVLAACDIVSGTPIPIVCDGRELFVAMPPEGGLVGLEEVPSRGA